MAYTTGTNVYVLVGAASPAATKPGGQQDGTLTRTMSTAETTNKDDANWKTSLDAVREWSVTLTCVYDQSDTGYGVIRDAWENQTDFYVQMLDNESGEKFDGQARVTDVTLNAATPADASTYTMTAEGTGTLTTS